MVLVVRLSNSMNLSFKKSKIEEVCNSLDRRYIEEFCRKYSLLSTDISFEFHIIDDIPHVRTAGDEDEDVGDIDDMANLSKLLSTIPGKVCIKHSCSGDSPYSL
jgi:hypothetical protein